MNELITENNQTLQDIIYSIRNLQVMLDKDLAELDGLKTKVFNQAVKRNIERFPKDFMFQLTKQVNAVLQSKMFPRKEEFENWRSKFVTSNKNKMGLRRSPHAFTERGVSMLSVILKSSTAVDISVKIIRTFVKRDYLQKRHHMHQILLTQRVKHQAI